MKINPKSEKGAITLIVLVGMLFLTTFLISMYIATANKAQDSAETTKQIQEEYNNLEEANAIYDSYFADKEIIPIYTREQLEKIGTGAQITIDGKIYTFAPNGYYTLKNDLDLGGYYNTSTNTWEVPDGKEWTALPSTFTGILDGLGHTITGLYINNTSASNQGLFGTLNGTVKNLNILGSYINAKDYVGAIAGLNEGTIQNCNNKATVIGTNNVGGIAGNLTKNIVNCTNTGTIVGQANVTGGYFKSIETGETIDVWSDKVLEENAYFVSGRYTATAPKGFKVSKNIFEQTIEEGMVIQDEEENEFVWVPVEGELASSYSSGTDYNEPAELKGNYESYSGAAYDSQTSLDFLYGQDYYNYERDFKYAEEYTEMVKNVNEYNGFYIGRYETTIDGKGNIGSKYDTSILTEKTILFTKNEIDYSYRWYGLYYAQKNANITGNGTDIQTTMIYGVLWDKTMDFIRAQKAKGNTTYDVDKATPTWHKGSNLKKSAQANSKDIALNIWDLECNAYEWTQESGGSTTRVVRGGNIWEGEQASCATARVLQYPDKLHSHSSRLALYIKAEEEEK